VPTERRKLECGLRLVEGVHEGLTREWWFGIAELDPGRLTLSWRTLLMRRRVVVVEVQSVYTSPVRKMGWALSMAINPGAPVLQLGTAGAVLEWVIAKPADREWAVERLQAGSNGRAIRPGPT
jgi:hypothetical protein